MTQTLKQFTADQRARYLARIAERYLPNPGIDPPPEVSPDDAVIQERILKEIKAHLGITSEETPEDKKAILEYLSEGMSEAILENADLKAIEDRLIAAIPERIMKEVETLLGITDFPSENTTREFPNLKAITVEELVSRLQNEDTPRKEASMYAKELIHRLEPLLRRTSNPNLGVFYTNYADDVFYQLFRALPQLRDPKAFPSFFQAIAATVAANYARNQPRSARQGRLRMITSRTLKKLRALLRRVS